MIGCCAPVGLLGKVADVGFDFLEIKSSELLHAPNNPAIPIRALNNFIPRTASIFCESDLYTSFLSETDQTLRISHDKGIKTITLGSGKARRISGNISSEFINSRWNDFLCFLNGRAMDLDLQIGIEPLVRSETNFLNSISDVANVTDLSIFDKVGLTVDSYHFYEEKDTLENIDDNSSKIFHVHISADDRTFPSELSSRNLIFLSRIFDSRYQGDVSIEIAWNSPLDIKGDVIRDINALRRL